MTWGKIAWLGVAAAAAAGRRARRSGAWTGAMIMEWFRRQAS